MKGVLEFYLQPKPGTGTLKIVSQYDQEIPQSYTTDKPMAPRGRAPQQLRDTRKTNYAKNHISLFPIKMIAKPEWT